MKILVPTDITAGGETMYIEMRKPNWWRYQRGKLKLFFGIVCWLPWKWGQEWCLSPRTAWDVSCIVHNYRNDMAAYRNATLLTDDMNVLRDFKEQPHAQQ